MKYLHISIALAVACILLASISAYSIMKVLESKSAANSEHDRAEYFTRAYRQTKDIAGIQGEPEDIHIHADFKVVLNGVPVNFSRKDFNVRNAFVHLHIDNPKDADKVIHIESKGITLGHFFNTLGMKFTSNCFVNEATEYCDSSIKHLFLFVNGERNYEMDNYIPKNEDRILVIYGNSSPKEIEEQIGSVSSFSKNYSQEIEAD